MSDWQISKDVIALIGAVGGLWVRLEVGQALNRQNIRALWARRKEDTDAIEKKLDQLHDDQKEMRREVRDEIKALGEALREALLKP